MASAQAQQQPLLYRLAKGYASQGYFYHAAYLAYLTLLNLVPLLAVMLAFLSHLTVFSTMITRFENWLINALLFQHKHQWVLQQVHHWVAQASHLSLLHTISFLVMAMIMMVNVNKVFQRIWRTERSLSLSLHCLLYIAILCLCPVVLVCLFGLSDLLLPLLIQAAWVQDMGMYHAAHATFALGAMFLWFLLMYKVLPLCHVPWRSAVLSSAVVTVLLFALKQGAMIGVDHYSSYQDLYGAMAALPICLIWLYLAWNVILLGSLLGYEVAQSR